ncbi:MAG TPA: RHS repeat-associated core domain-containing protein, partial [Candidatus Acidoferrum sp.]|nr:RHS repeat-associated core domain-containing protein [Candidatus Acidoferrum sp.]
MTSQGCATPPGICQIGPIQSGGTATTSQDMSYTFTDASGHNNGNVVTIANNLDMDRTQSFTYDSLNRLSSAWTTGTNQPAFNGDTDYLQECWSENYSYDPWGNLLKLGPGSSSSYTGCTQESGFDFSSSGSIGANNRIAVSGYVYDAAGNLITSPGAGTVTFNAENQMVSAGGVNYLYDGDGKRVSKSNGTLYWYGTGSDPLLETTNAGAAFNSYIYFDGKRVGKSTTLGPGGISWFMTDHLGTSRVVSSTAGSDVSDFYPFGGERVVQATSGVSNHYKFTGKERDGTPSTETGLDYFGARYYSNGLGRWVSADWSATATPVPYADFVNPQSLN